jgi:hypothetical protein
MIRVRFISKFRSLSEFIEAVPVYVILWGLVALVLAWILLVALQYGAPMGGRTYVG